MGGVEWGLGSGDLVLVDSSLGGVEGGEYLLCWAWCGAAESLRRGRVVSLGEGWGRKIGRSVVLTGGGFEGLDVAVCCDLCVWEGGKTARVSKLVDNFWTGGG